nr:MAG TPA: hypothetical protein [Caudoviricetes sp.]
MPELDLGNVKGPQGKSAYQSALDAGYSGSEEAFNTAMAKAPDAVLYMAQNLTDAQKAQARGNINAAPGGFGLGGIVATIPANANLNDYIRTGFFGNGNTSVIRTWINTPANWPANEAILEVYALGNYAIQRISAVTTKVSAQRSQLNNVWAEWEWINPPMQLGVEYRTTGRYLGRPVYCKLVDFGNLPNNTYKDVAHGISNLQRAISVSGESNGDNLIGNRYITYVHIDSTNISIKTNADRSGVSATVLIKYTKTTD